MTTFKAFHKESYAAIDPASPANSQVGRTILVTGAGTGIGFEIAKSYLVASAAMVIIIGRRVEILKTAAAKLEASKPKGSLSTVLWCQLDISEVSSTENFWTDLKSDGIEVDVLVLNAASPAQFSVSAGSKKVWDVYETNVLGNLRMSEALLAQGPKKGKAIINISTVIVHANPARIAEVYSSTKASFAHLLQNYAGEIPVEECQMISCHPGRIFTEGAVAAGHKEDSIPSWHNINLPGSWSVWASTPQAAFLHGRFVWANWDVEELADMNEEFLDSGFLQMGLQGIPPVSIAAFFAMG